MNSTINIFKLLLEKATKEFSSINSSTPSIEEIRIASQLFELNLNFIFPVNCEIDIQEYLYNVLYNDDYVYEEIDGHDYLMLTNEQKM